MVMVLRSCEDDASKDVQKVSQPRVRTTHADLIDLYQRMMIVMMVMMVIVRMVL